VFEVRSKHEFFGEFYFKIMSKICGIYKITSPTGKIYIGQSVDIERRWADHRSMPKSDKGNLLYNSFLSHGVDSHKFEILERCSKEMLNEREIYYIEKYQTFDTEHGLNLTKGGDSNVVFSKKTLQKMSEAKKGVRPKHLIGHKHSKETRDILRKKAMGNKNWLGKHHSEETKEKLRQANLGKKASKETREKISKASKGRKYPPEFGKRASLAQMGTKPKGPTSSKFYGVCYLSTRHRWVARITLFRKRIYIGCFKTEIEAAKAYDNFVKENIPYKIPLNFE
jgi:group I intron endonuclease